MFAIDDRLLLTNEARKDEAQNKLDATQAESSEQPARYRSVMEQMIASGKNEQNKDENDQ